MLAYLQNIAVLFCINAILAVTLNFIMGYAGIFSLAHAVFFGIGAYAAAWTALHIDASLWLCLVVGMSLAGVLSLLLSLPALRVRGEYFVAASLGIQMIAITIFSEWTSVTGGLGGLVGIPPPQVFGLELTTPSHFVPLGVLGLLAVLVITTVLSRGSFGRSLMAIRDSESAAQAAGKSVAVIKALSVALSAALSAVAGVIYAFYMSFINVESFMLDASILLMAMVIIGGTGTILGPIVGAAVLMALPAALSFVPFLPSTELGNIQQLIYGACMVVLMLFRPGGIVGRVGSRA